MRCKNAERKRGLTRRHGDAEGEMRGLERIGRFDRVMTAPRYETGGQRPPIVMRVARSLSGGTAWISPRLRHGGA